MPLPAGHSKNIVVDHQTSISPTHHPNTQQPILNNTSIHSPPQQLTMEGTILPFRESKSTKATTVTSPFNDGNQTTPEIQHEDVPRPSKVTRFLSKFQSSAVKSSAEMERRDKEEEKRTGVKKNVQPVSLLAVCEAATNAQAKYAWAA
ncbi:hypothetical protein QBC34DRAFT_413509 [Podospora aff. communis PSN243]|uniref:Uncharacterized protein n=1 Tax=Podospora aff. communis PSN243 TaxID=3040156 RepID=A0AAV9GCZ8_9PEZI|nr:hypothetical protein QBC34DRAFT_413509 [Podospora aff. communis PSN243]